VKCLRVINLRIARAEAKEQFKNPYRKEHPPTGSHYKRTGSDLANREDLVCAMV
jgi:hypothetical protein